MLDHVVYENENYRVLRFEPAEPTTDTVVYFQYLSAALHHAEPRDFEPVKPDNFVTMNRMNGLFVQTRRNDWFQNEGILDLLRFVAAAKRPGEIYVAYGSSMGGHAAVSFSDLIDADFFLAISPQVSIAPSFMDEIGDTRWRENGRSFVHDFVLEGRCAGRRGLVAYDARHPLDLVHTDRILGRTSALALDCPGTWHHSGKLLNRMFGIMTLIRRMMALLRSGGDMAAFVASLRAEIDADPAARFVRSGAAGRIALLAAHGAVKFGLDIEFEALRREFLRDPSPEAALVLHVIAKEAKAVPVRRNAAETLRRNGYPRLAAEIDTPPRP